MSYHLYLSYLSLKYYNILPWPPCWAPCIYSSQSHQLKLFCPMILSASIIPYTTLYDLAPVNSLTNFSIALFPPYYALTILVFLLLLQYAKHVSN